MKIARATILLAAFTTSSVADEAWNRNLAISGLNGTPIVVAGDVVDALSPGYETTLMGVQFMLSQADRDASLTFYATDKTLRAVVEAPDTERRYLEVSDENKLCLPPGSVVKVFRLGGGDAFRLSWIDFQQGCS